MKKLFILFLLAICLVQFVLAQDSYLIAETTSEVKYAYKHVFMLSDDKYGSAVIFDVASVVFPPTEKEFTLKGEDYDKNYVSRITFENTYLGWGKIPGKIVFCTDEELSSAYGIYVASKRIADESIKLNIIDESGNQLHQNGKRADAPLYNSYKLKYSISGTKEYTKGYVALKVERTHPNVGEYITYIFAKIPLINTPTEIVLDEFTRPTDSIKKVVALLVK